MAREKQIENNLKELKSYAKLLEQNLDDQDHLHYYLTVTFGIESYAAYFRWRTKAKKPSDEVAVLLLPDK